MAFNLRILLRQTDPVVSVPIDTPSTLRIEKMKRSYLKEVIKIERTSFTSNWRKGMFREVFYRRDSLFLVALQGEQIVGYVICLVEDEKSHIINLAVHPDFRRRNIGERLMLYALKESASRKATKAHLELRVSNNSAKKLYEKLGFRAMGIRERYYPDNREDALVMWVDDIDPHEYQRRISLFGKGGTTSVMVR